MPSHGHPSTNTSGRGLGAMMSVKMGQDHQEGSFEIYFWRSFFIPGLYFASNRPEMHYLRHFKLKIAKWPLRSKFELDIRARFHSEPQKNRRTLKKTYPYIITRILYFWPSFCPKPTRNAINLMRVLVHMVIIMAIWWFVNLETRLLRIMIPLTWVLFQSLKKYHIRMVFISSISRRHHAVTAVLCWLPKWTVCILMFDICKYGQNHIIVMIE